jgi:hypothetical protein
MGWVGKHAVHLKSAWAAFGEKLHIPLGCWDGRTGRLCAGNARLGHHVVSRVKIFTVLYISLSDKKPAASSPFASL